MPTATRRRARPPASPLRWRLFAAAPALVSLLFSACGDDDLSGPGPESAPDGPRIVYSTFEPATGRWGVGTIGLEGADPRTLPVDPGNPDGSRDVVFFGFQWSPDGGRLLYRSSRTNTDDWALTLVRADGSEKRHLTDPNGFAVDPRWSPDGQRILYERGGFFGERAGVGFQTAIVDLDGTSVDFFIADEGALFEGRPVHFSLLPIADSTLFDPVPAVYDAAFAPNGRDLYVVGSFDLPLWDPRRRAVDTELFRVSSTTGRILGRVTRNAIDESGFQLSDDGEHLLFTLPAGPTASPIAFRLYTLDLPAGDHLGRVTDDWHELPPRWANDGRHVAFARPESGDLAVYVVDTEAPGSERRVFLGGSQPDLFLPR